MFNNGGDDYVPESWEDEIDDFAESFILTGKREVTIINLYHMDYGRGIGRGSKTQ